jgi:hypothetical protein
MEAMDEPVKGSGEGALSGAAQGAAGPLTFGVGSCQGGPFFCVVGLALGIALAVPSAMVGGVVGAVNAHPEEEVDAATQNLLSALVAAAPDDALAANLPDMGRMIAGVDLKLNDWEQGRAVDYEPLIDKGFDSVVEITVKTVRIDVLGDINPDLSPIVIVEARLLSIPEGKSLYQRVWHYSGVERDYFDAAEDDARLLHSDLAKGYSHLASRIVDDLFVTQATEKSERPQPGTVVTIAGSSSVTGAMSASGTTNAPQSGSIRKDVGLKSRFAPEIANQANSSQGVNSASTPKGTQSATTSPPFKSREEVELYLQAHEEDIAQQIFAYLDKHDMIRTAGSHPSKAAGTARLEETSIVRLSGEDVIINAEYRIPQSFQNAYSEQEFLLRWISGDLVLLGRTTDQIPNQDRCRPISRSNPEALGSEPLGPDNVRSYGRIGASTGNCDTRGEILGLQEIR